MLPRARPRREERLLTSRQAAEKLGVKLETLYAYVARGMLRGEGTGGRDAAGPHGRRYAQGELDAFLARRRWSRRVVTSAVSSTDGGKLLYRGHDAVALAERASFEQVAALLWTGTLGGDVVWPEVAGEAIEGAVRAAKAVGSAPPLVQAQILVAALAAADDARGAIDAENVRATARRLVTRLVAAVGALRGAPLDEAGRGPIAARVLATLTGGRQPAARAGVASVRLTERALVLSAEHELNASTFAARVAASTGADPYAVAAAGMAALSGPKHGGMTDRVEAVLRGATSPDEDPPLGFGHPLYPDGDPRTAPLLGAARAVGGAGADVARAFARVDAVAARGGPRPTVDVGLATTAMALGLEPGLSSTLFAFGRTAGWMAHALEQYGLGELIRPRARYVGPSPEEA